MTIDPVNSGSSNIVDPSSTDGTTTSFSAVDTSNTNDPWSFGGYFSPEESKKFQDQMEQNIVNQIKKDQAKSHEASEELKRSIEGDDLYKP